MYYELAMEKRREPERAFDRFNLFKLIEVYACCRYYLSHGTCHKHLLRSNEMWSHTLVISRVLSIVHTYINCTWIRVRLLVISFVDVILLCYPYQKTYQKEIFIKVKIYWNVAIASIFPHIVYSFL